MTKKESEGKNSTKKGTKKLELCDTMSGSCVKLSEEEIIEKLKSLSYRVVKKTTEKTLFRVDIKDSKKSYFIKGLSSKQYTGSKILKNAEEIIKGPSYW